MPTAFPPDDTASGAATAIARIDAFAYRHRVAELMTAPPLVVPPEATLAAVVALLAGHNVGSVLIRPAGAAEPSATHGILTERDILALLRREGGAALERLAGQVMSTPLVTIGADAFAYRAIGRMHRHRIRHLGVTDTAGGLVGVLSIRDLMRLRAETAINLGDAIAEAPDAAALKAAWRGLAGVASALLGEGLPARHIAAVISSELAALAARAAALAAARLADEGRGPAPRPWSLLLLGSAGRGESLLAMDQDTALVFADGPKPDAGIDPWFAAFGRQVSDLLNEAGVPYCRGGVMAANVQWRGSVAAWRARLGEWMRRSRPADLMNVDIFFDLAPAAGDTRLAQGLRDAAFATAAHSPAFIKLLAEAGTAGGSPFGLFGRLRTEAGRLDLKRAGLFRIVTIARCLALRHGIKAAATDGRLLGLQGMGLGGEEDLDRLAAAHGYLLDLILRQQLADIADGTPPTNTVRLDRLSRTERRRLKETLASLKTAPELLRDLLFAAVQEREK